MNCKRCGKEMRIGTEQVGIDNRNLPVIHRFAYCDTCREKTDLDIFKTNDTKANDTTGKISALSIVALVISILGCGCISVVGFLLALIDVLKKDGRNKVLSIIAMCVSVIWFGIFILVDTEEPNETKNENNKQTTTQEITTEATTEDITEATTEMSFKDFQKEAQEVTYDDIYRNPETYSGVPIKITLYVDEYDTAYLGLVDVYYCKIDGKDVYVEDYRTVKEPTIASGDTVIIYGYGSGMATLTESQKNIIGITTDSQKSQIPSIDMHYVELQ